MFVKVWESFFRLYLIKILTPQFTWTPIFLLVFVFEFTFWYLCSVCIGQYDEPTHIPIMHFWCIHNELFYLLGTDKVWGMHTFYHQHTYWTIHREKKVYSSNQYIQSCFILFIHIEIRFIPMKFVWHRLFECLKIYFYLRPFQNVVVVFSSSCFFSLNWHGSLSFCHQQRWLHFFSSSFLLGVFGPILFGMELQWT